MTSSETTPAPSPAASRGPVTTSDEDHAQWADAAAEVLGETAGAYRAVITHKLLAEKVQERAGVHTTRQTRHWLGDVLARVARACAAEHRPLLNALAVDARGSVGTGYAATVEEAYGELPADGDDHAAKERLACYRAAEATGIPSTGGTPALTPQVETRRRTARKTAHAERVRPTCPNCHTELPATGECDYCA